MTRAPIVLVVDDKVEMAETVADGLEAHGLTARFTAKSRDAIAILEKESIDVLVTDLRMPEIDGLALLEASKKLDPARPVVVMTAYGAVDTAIESIRRGAHHYVTKPFAIEELAIFVRRAFEEAALRREANDLRRAIAKATPDPSIVASSKAMREVLEVVERVAESDVPVLLLGETGTGKSLVARKIHQRGRRAEKPFVTVSCAAIPATLLESELFGHAKGAFTGATEARAGLFAEADGGTIFLDEIGDLPLALQPKLLDVLERSVVRAVGDTRERKVDVRVVAATHRDLRDLERKGLFRGDLLFRLDVVSIEIPPLRARREDVAELAERAFAEARARHPSSPARALAPEAMKRLLDHRWPGNVRELIHVVERAVVLAKGPTIGEDALPETVRAPSTSVGFEGPVEPLRSVQKRYAAWAYETMGRHRARTAEALDIDVKTLSKLLDEEKSR